MSYADLEEAMQAVEHMQECLLDLYGFLEVEHMKREKAKQKTLLERGS